MEPQPTTIKSRQGAQRRSISRRASSALVSWIGGFALRGLSWYAQRLSQERANRLGSSIGRLLFKCTPHRRGIALRNVSFALQKSEEESCRIVAACYANIGKCLLEFLRLPALIRRGQLFHLVTTEGEEHLKAALAKGKGVILLTGHFGNWELLGAWLVARGYTLNVLARRQNDKGTTDLVDGLRQTSGMQVISAREGAVNRVLARLRRGEIVGFLADQNAVRDGLFVDFFGRPASTHAGAAFFALRTGAAVIPGFGVRNHDDTHSGYILPEVELIRTGNLHKDIEANTAAFTRIIEEQIRRRPDMWFWLHDRWRTRPPIEIGGSSADKEG